MGVGMSVRVCFCTYVCVGMIADHTIYILLVYKPEEIRGDRQCPT